MQLQFVQKRSDRSIPEIQRVEGLKCSIKRRKNKKNQELMLSIPKYKNILKCKAAFRRCS